ncbi:MAG TPA: hypothetical protein VGE93_02820 [Bryobacteraceae bacterium]
MTIAGIASGGPANAAEPHLIEWLDKLIDIQFKISSQLLHLETSRDAVELGVSTPAETCDPTASKPVYDSVDLSLSQLIADAPKFRMSSQEVARLHAVQKVWASVARRHRRTWSESDDLPGIQPADRCLRASAVTDSRLELEREMSALLKDSIRSLDVRHDCR